MKLFKIITAVVISFGMMVAQPPAQGGNQGGTQGPPPCDEWLNSSMAHDRNGDDTVDENDCPQQGPDPFQQAFMTTMQNGGTPDEAFEAVSAVHHQMDVECDDCEMTEEEFQEGKAEAKAAFDAVLADGGTPQEAMHAAMEAGNDGPPTCDVCGYTFTGEGDHHGHCDRCDFVFTSDNDQHGHCDKCDFVFSSDNDQHGHCDQCDYIFSGEGDQHGHCDKCDHIWSGDPEDHHGHCDHEGCDFVGNTNEDWENHSHDDGGTGGPGGAPTNHWDGNCAAMCEGHGEYWLDSDGDGQPEDGPYATWDHDADGNPVDCGCGGDEGDEGDEGEGEGDEGEGEGDEGDEGDEGGPMAGDTCQFMDADGVQCSYVFTGTEADQDHHHN